MSLVARKERREGVHVVTDIDELVSFVAAHPRDLVVLREATPASRERLRDHALRFGSIVEARGFGELRTVRHDPTVTTSTALSLGALAFHTDGSFLERPPPRFMMSCIRADQGGGGVSTFYPLDDLLAALPGWAVDALRTADYLFPQGYDGDTGSSWTAPVLTGAAGDARIRWRSDHLFRPPVVRGRGVRADEAAEWLHEHLAAGGTLTYALRPGETIVVPNEMMLHGRTALTSGSERELLRVWVA